MKIKKILFKKSTWVILALFLVTAVAIPNLKPKADTDVKMNILEIEPGNQFILNDSVEGVNVTKMTMAQFNSMRDEIFGKYDATVIGRVNNDLNQKFSEKAAYRDYSTEFSQKISDVQLTYDSKDRYSEYSKKLWYTQSNNSPVTGIKDNGFTWQDGNTYVEYYSPNDITNLRAKEILKMIDNNQIVYIDNEIMNSDSLSGSKLLANFKGSKAKTFDQGSISVKSLYDEFLSKNADERRPVLTNIVNPVGDDKTAVAGNIDNREMKVSFNLDGGDDCTAKLYLDYDCDGLFKDSEYTGKEYKLSQCKNEDGSYTVMHDLDTTFVGYLQWKLVVSRSNGVQTYITGAAQYRALDGKAKVINVLQVYPENCTEAIRFTDSKLKQKLDDVVDYQFNISTTSCREFNGAAGNSITIDSYDMLVIGLADRYGGVNDFSQSAINLIQQYINKGKSVMFTHDTMSLNEFATTTWDHHTGPAMLTAQFRDQIGQAVYKDPFSTYNNLNANGEVIDYITNKDADGNDVQKVIPHSDIASNAKVKADFPNATNIVSMGTTLYARYANNDTDIGASNGDGWTKTLSTSVKEINSASITEYPYNLDKTIKVATTHTQWYRLNLEDEDVVPMYNLSNGCFDDGDSENFYYTYNKGNVTYSGTGHSEVGDETELKLFVNTIVRAVRGANTAPTITNYDANKKAEIAETDTVTVDQYEDYNFVTNVFDKDQDKINVSITLDGNTVFTQDRVKSDTDLSVNIPESYFENYDEDTVGTITVNATDTQGNSSSKSFKIKINPVPKDFYVDHGIYKSKNISDFDALGDGKEFKNSMISSISPYDNNYFEEFGFVGTANVNCKDGTIKLTVDESYKAEDGSFFIGDVNVYALSNDKLKLLGKATIDNNSASYNFSKSNVEAAIGDVDKNYTLVITYKCKTYNKKDGESLKYTNKIEVSSKDYSKNKSISIDVQNDVKNWDLY